MSLEETTESFESAKNKIQEMLKNKVSAQIDDAVRDELVRSGRPAEEFIDHEFHGIRQKEITTKIEMKPGKIQGTIADLALITSAVRVDFEVRM